jgi:glycosyltransferase involved in cell wall biosynthesis
MTAKNSIVIDPLAFAMRRIGGVARVWSTVLQGLCRADGLDVCLTGPDPKPPSPGPDFEAKILALEKGYAIPANWRRFIPYRGPADVFFPTYLRPSNKGIRNIQLVHDCIKEITYPTWKSALVRTRRKRIFQQADRILAISQGSREDIYRIYGLAIGDRVRVIPNPVDLEYIRHCINAESGQAEWDKWQKVIGRRPFSVFIGARRGVKNFREVRNLLAALPDYLLIAVGNEPNREELELSAAFPGRVHYAGRLPDAVMFKMLQASNFLFFPSVFEGFGMPVVESLLIGTPVLGINTQVNREISMGLVTFFENGSIDSLRDSMTRIKRIPENAPALLALKERYGPQNIVNQYIQAIKELL